MNSPTLRSKIRRKTVCIGVIGLGYVGLPLAVLAAKKGFRVTGFARDERKIALLNNGVSTIEAVSQKDLKALINKGTLHIKHLSSSDFDKEDIYIICVPTPVDEEKNPDLGPIRDVANRLSQVALEGKLIINESTVAPGTTREEFGNYKGKYFLAFSPERIDPGNIDRNVATIPKIVGGVTMQSTSLAQKVYQMIIDAPVFSVSSLETAETVKMLENTYRAVNIALVNEFARLAEKIGLDILEIIEAAKTKWSYQPHYPSLGVGGHCIPVDPWYLVEYAKKKRVNLPLIVQGLLENDAMTSHVANKIISFYKKGKSVLIYGLTYKKNVSDLRESPVLRLTQRLKEKNIPFTVYDPLLGKDEIRRLGFIPADIKKVDIFIVGSDHDELRSDYKRFVGARTNIIDGKNFFRKKVGKAVYGVGRTLL